MTEHTRSDDFATMIFSESYETGLSCAAHNRADYIYSLAKIGVAGSDSYENVAHYVEATALLEVIGGLACNLMADIEDLERLAKIGPVHGPEAAHRKRETEALCRLGQFAEWTGTKAPASVQDEDGAPSDELLTYCDEQDLSLDWVFKGGVKNLVLGLRRAANADDISHKMAHKQD